ncbi:MAG: hypothetical protein ACLFRS_02555 [Halomonas sp.]
MSDRPLVMLHGWNDEGRSFERLVGHLRKRLGPERIQRIAIGDYLSKDDCLRFDDLQAALDRAWTRHDLPREPASVDVIVHSTGYGGIRAVANEEGGDGTVRLSTANLNCARVRIAFREEARGEGRVTVPEMWDYRPSSGRCAFRILDGIDHSAIKLDAAESRLSRAQRDTLTLIERALTVEDAGFIDFCDECEAENRRLTRGPGERRGKPGFQNTVVRVRDQFDVPVEDYLIEFYDSRDDRRDGGGLARAIHEEAIRKVHNYRADASLRSLYIDTARLCDAVARAGTQLGMSITAEPMLEEDEQDARHTPVGFRTLADEDIDDLRLDDAQLAEFFQPHRTLLVDICVHRSQADNVFRLNESRG